MPIEVNCVRVATLSTADISETDESEGSPSVITDAGIDLQCIGVELDCLIVIVLESVHFSQTPQCRGSPLSVTKVGTDLQGIVVERNRLPVLLSNPMYISETKKGGCPSMAIVNVGIEVKRVWRRTWRPRCTFAEVCKREQDPTERGLSFACRLCW